MFKHFNEWAAKWRNSPEGKEHIRKYHQEKWKDPEYRKKKTFTISKSFKPIQSIEKYRKKCYQYIAAYLKKRLATDPEFRERHNNYAREYFKKRSQELGSRMQKETTRILQGILQKKVSRPRVQGKAKREE